VSDVTAHVIDEEIRVLIDSNFMKAKDILTRDIDKLHKMAEALIKYETIDESQIADIMQGRDPKPPADWEDRDLGTPSSKPRERRSGEGDTPTGTPAPQH
ncbi:MAG TPA: ATP-dependent metalloprotease, partial [Steroidobacteraceae bacterium]|nr:ATP-dependent metalloprotease [Steroidobacteraceae bacterium]